MNVVLWGKTPIGLSMVLDSTSPLDRLKKLKIAKSLIDEKPLLKKAVEIIDWIKRVKIFLGEIFGIYSEKNPNLSYLRSVSHGDFDNQNIGLLLSDIETNVSALDRNELLMDEAAEIAHKAITHWAMLEVNSDV